MLLCVDPNTLISIAVFAARCTMAGPCQPSYQLIRLIDNNAERSELMLDRLVTFFKALPSGESGKGHFSRNDPRLAAAALMFHVMDADGERHFFAEVEPSGHEELGFVQLAEACAFALLGHVAERARA